MATVEEPKPAVTTDAGAVEPTPAPAETLTADKPVEAVEPKPEEPAKTEAEPVAAAEEKKEEKAEEKPVEPVYSGALGYKAPGLKNAFRYSKKYFWFGEEAVPVQSLSHYLRGEKAEVAHPTAAWSSQTGKGLLYFVKHADQKETPAGVLNLAEATELAKDGIVAFHFKLHGHKHAFEGATKLERDGWFIAIEKAIDEAKASKESIVGSEGYKEEIGKLNKPALAAAVAKNSTPKKSVEAPKPAEAEASTSTEVAAAPARTGSSSSSSSDEEKKKKKASKSKSRSVSRGKRASIFGGFFNKDKEEKKEEKKEEEAKKEETPAPAVEPVAATAPVITEDIPKVGEELKNEATVPAAEPAAAATTTPEVPKEETKPAAEEKPKPAKRGSIFGSFVEKLKSPTTEKKESEVGPAPPAKEPEVAAATEAPKVEEPVAAAPAPVDATTEAPKEEKKEEVKPATTPAKEKQHFSFGKFLGGAKEKVKSPTTEKSPVEAAKTTEEPAKAEETPAPVAPVEPAAEAPKEEAVKPTEEAPATTTPAATKTKRGSIFGNLTGSVKKDKEGETSEKPKGLSGLFRQASKAGKSKKEKEPATTTPPKVEEETAATEPAKEEKKEEAPLATEPASIGDVVPSAVSVGEAPKSTPQVSASA